jgi:hypothetical protein
MESSTLCDKQRTSQSRVIISWVLGGHYHCVEMMIREIVIAIVVSLKSKLT